jgi:hypothetical protein
MSPTPNYVALVKLLPTLRNLVDACGEVTLTADEAAPQIRMFGFQGEEGRWRVPPVPPELVRDNPLLENLAIGWDSRRDVAQRNATIKRRSEREITRRMVAEIAQKILRAVESAGGQIQKRKLQAKFWRYPRMAFQEALRNLVSGQLIGLDGKTVVLHIRPPWSFRPRVTSKYSITFTSPDHR